MNNPLNRRQFLQVSSLAALTTAFPVLANKNNLLTDTPELWKPYKNSIVIDGLSGAIGWDTKELDEEKLALFKRSGITAVNTTIAYPGDNFAQAEEKVTHGINLIKKHADVLTQITSVADIVSTKKNQQFGTIFGFQSTEMFGDDLSRIEHFARRGVRYMQMSYNNASQFGDGGLVKANRGLTPLGKEALKEMERNKVLVDLSHSGQKTVAEAIALSSRPLTISHTGCNAVYPHPRNNDDKELKAVADKGGVVGIYLMPFLSGGTGEVKASAFVKHVKHALNICGEDQVAIGSDQGVLPVNDTPEYRESVRRDVERRIAAGISAPGETPDRPPFIPELNGINRMELTAIALSKAGISDTVVEKILGKNLLNLYARVW